MTLNFPQLKESCSTALEWKVGSEDPSGPVMSDVAAAVAWRGMGMAAMVAQWLESDFSIVCVWPFGLQDYGSTMLRCKI